MPHQIVQYLLTFSFSTGAAIYYSVFWDNISYTYMFVLLVSVINLAFISSSLLTIENEIHLFLRFKTSYRGDIDAVLRRLIEGLHRPSVSKISTPLELVQKIGTEIRIACEISTPTTGITFVGAVSLQTPDEGSKLEPVQVDEGEDQQSPFQIYQGALEEATSRRVFTQRFVNLPTSDELKARSHSVSADYMRWLKNQISQISRNEQNFLVDTPRAPKWGVAGARIILNESMFDITHKNGMSLHLRDQRIAEMQTQKIRTAALSGSPKNVTVYCKEKDIGEATFPGTNIVDIEAMNLRFEALKKAMT